MFHNNVKLDNLDSENSRVEQMKFLAGVKVCKSQVLQRRHKLQISASEASHWDVGCVIIWRHQPPVVGSSMVSPLAGPVLVTGECGVLGGWSGESGATSRGARHNLGDSPVADKISRGQHQRVISHSRDIHTIDLSTVSRALSAEEVIQELRCLHIKCGPSDNWVSAASVARIQFVLELKELWCEVGEAQLQCYVILTTSASSALPHLANFAINI